MYAVMLMPLQSFSSLEKQSSRGWVNWRVSIAGCCINFYIQAYCHIWSGQLIGKTGVFCESNNLFRSLHHGGQGCIDIGLLVFLSQDETSQNIILRSLPDIIPEGEERYSVVLTAVSGGASLRPGFMQATVVIPANDDAFGVLSVASDSRDVYTQESSQVTIKYANVYKSNSNAESLQRSMVLICHDMMMALSALFAFCF